ncbi:ATP-dependent RNA helicase ROK1 [Hondaea fermentalgiana]|uniref:RNA helicase n=1 Tax=Hondaea fermentalgiana TaxID=2315210 RepID=A0A2R5GLB5_9STRA|nr:ATP-dependent RNA helicase ROK1 [Hondaea fermentalgiana]|eukprot:GBG31696.1 ATP-dependent RNA helicase ROK1 [Hondaea fermentalgiana]
MSGPRSLTEDVFSSLVGGLKFDKNANALALDVMRKRPRVENEKSKDEPNSGAAKNGDNKRKSALDFFAAGPAKTAAATSKKQTSKKSEAKRKDKTKSKTHADSDSDDDRVEEAETEKAVVDANADADADKLSVSEVRALRKRMRIKVRGSDVRDPMLSFSVAGLQAGAAAAGPALRERAQTICENVERSRYTEPTAIQMESLPALLAGRDLLGCAPTGSGKTAAFLLPMLMRLRTRPTKVRGPEGLIIAPTRELAAQIVREFEKLALGIKGLRAALLRKGIKSPGRFDALVTTPERLAAMVAEKRVDLSTVHYLVLDEADKLFEMGFLEHVDEIINACGPETQRVMVSATMPPQIEELAQSVLRDPVEVVVGTKNAGAATIDQKLIFAGQENGKMTGLKQLIQDGELTPPTLIFVQTKERAQQLFEELVYDGYKIDAIHSDRTQQQRDDVVRRFRAGQVWILICTELLGRGIDFKGVRCVVNYDFPTSAVSYVHRIGRTGRANQLGKAYTFFTHDDIEFLRPIANVMRLSGCEVPDWMLKLRKPSSNERKAMQQRAPKRAAISSRPSAKKRRKMATKDGPSRDNKKRPLKTHASNKSESDA